MELAKSCGDDGPILPAQSSPPEAPPEQVQPWEQVDAGRFMPRRIRGSCVGRALG
jgi:hypothetical protein